MAGERAGAISIRSTLPATCSFAIRPTIPTPKVEYTLWLVAPNHDEGDRMADMEVAEAGGAVTEDTCHTALVLRVGGRPVCGWPVAAPPRVRSAAAQRLLGLTPKRRALRLGLRAAALTGTADWWGSVESLAAVPAGSAFTDALPSLLEHTHGACYAAIFWPSTPARDRLYVHLLDEIGDSYAFAKVAVDDAAALGTEAETLRLLAGGDRTSFATPRIIADSISTTGPQWLLMEPLPKRITSPRIGTTAYPSDVVNAYSGHSAFVPWESRESISWWPRLDRLLHSVSKSFLTDLANLMSDGIWTSRVHGDFGCHNLAQQGRMLWIYDWESSVVDGPASCDYWAFRFKSAGIMQTLRCEADGPREGSSLGCALLSMAYQGSWGMNLARDIITNWEFNRKELSL